jgi:hypothetical protein
MHRLDFVAGMKTGEAIKEGSICSIDSQGSLILGCGAGSAINKPMPMFAIQNWNDFDVNSDYDPIHGPVNMSGGSQSAVVATGGFEIETSEYNALVTYACNDLLVPSTAVGGVGKVTRAASGDVYGAAPVVGIVSQAANTNRDGTSVLRFWTTFLPANA